jgi:hypothetical protein
MDNPYVPRRFEITMKNDVLKVPQLTTVRLIFVMAQSKHSSLKHGSDRHKMIEINVTGKRGSG